MKIKKLLGVLKIMKIQKCSKLFCVAATLIMGLSPFLFASSSVYASEQSSADLSKVQAIEEKYTPEIVEKDGVVTESFVVSSADLAVLDSIYLANNISPRAWGSDIPKRTTTTYGSFKSGSVSTVAGVIVSTMGGAGGLLTIAGVIADTMGYGTVYYKYTHTSWRTNGVLYVRGRMDFYKNSSRTQHITTAYFNREYSDNMLD